MEKDGIDKLVEEVRQIAYRVHVYLASPHLHLADDCAPYGFGFAESALRFASLIFGASHG